ncbi:hypothetical protein AN644_01895 [Candidatus Epulonipiscium fishelsonii]|nr:hypothetical protein AN644_01895 [Epulopiscium sp. SCG-C06WGA-EpuloA1]
MKLRKKLIAMIASQAIMMSNLVAPNYALATTQKTEGTVKKDETQSKLAETTVQTTSASITYLGGGNTEDYIKEAPITTMNFITVDGTRLMDGDKEFRFASLNYPEALDKDSSWQQENIMETMQAMGTKVTRTYTIPTYNGTNKETAYVVGVNKEDKTGGEYGTVQFNEDVLVNLDQLLAHANEYGIRLIIPLVDHWSWVGGMEGYLSLATGENYAQKPFDDRSWEFYSNPQAIDYFMQMIDSLLNRTNTITGVQYKNDPAILCWETGNELGAYNQDQYDEQLFNLTNQIIERIHSNDAKQLVMDGRMSLTERSVSEENQADILGAHYYTGNYTEKTKQDAELANTANKPFILGEFGGITNATQAEPVFEAGYNHGADGVMMWSIRAHKDGWGFDWHDETPGNWAAYHWPGFNASEYYDEDDTLRVVYKYAQIMNGGTGNEAIPAPSQITEPVLFDIETVGDIKWRGVVGGAWYEIERTEDANPTEESEWIAVATKEDNVHDAGRSDDLGFGWTKGFHDLSAVDGKSYTYRLRAANESGVGLWSNYVTVKNANHFVKDNLDLIGATKNDQNSSEIRNVYSYDHSSSVVVEGGSIVNKAQDFGYITYHTGIPIKEIAINHNAGSKENALLYVSKDGVKFQEVTNTNLQDGTLSANLNGDYLYARVIVTGERKCQIDSIDVTYTNDGTVEIAKNNLSKDSQFVQDNKFKDGYAVKDNALVYKTKHGYSGLGLNFGKEDGEIIYQTYKDISSFRIKASAKDVKDIRISYSSEGLVYNRVTPEIKEGNNGWSELVFENMNMNKDAKYIKVEVLDPSVILSSVEYASGEKRIPYEHNPISILENGEIYFGQNENLQKLYINEDENGNKLPTKTLNNMDLSMFDTMSAWIRGDASNNILCFELEDNNGKVWRAEKLLDDSSSIENFKLNKDAIDLTNVAKMRIRVKYTNLDVKKGEIYLDNLTFKNSAELDGFENYSGSDAILNETYTRNGNGGKFETSLSPKNAVQGEFALKIDYDVEGAGYAGATKQLGKVNLKEYDGICLSYIPDGSGNTLTLQVKSPNGYTYETSTKMDSTGLTEIFIPFKDLKAPDWADNKGTFFNKEDSISEFSLYAGQNGDITSGTIYVDDIKGFNFIDNLKTANVLLSNKLNSEQLVVDNNGEKATDATPEIKDGEEKVTNTIPEIKVTEEKESGSLEITEFPYTFSGIASFVNYVTLEIGDAQVNVPVDEEGQWEYTLDENSEIYNGEALSVKALIKAYNGEVIKENGNGVITINVDGNEEPEEIEPISMVLPEVATVKGKTIILNGDFSQINKEGSPMSWNSAGGMKLENVDDKVDAYGIWADNAFNARLSQLLEVEEAGQYRLQFDMKAKNTLESAYVNVIQDKNIVLEESNLITNDAWQTFSYNINLEEGLTEVVFDGTLGETGDANFWIDNVELVRIGEIEQSNVVKGNVSINATFEDKHPVTNAPKEWNIDENKRSANFGYDKEGFLSWNAFESQTDGIDVTLSQDITIKETGTYNLSALYKFANIEQGYLVIEKNGEIISRDLLGTKVDSKEDVKVALEPIKNKEEKNIESLELNKTQKGDDNTALEPIKEEVKVTLEGNKDDVKVELEPTKEEVKVADVTDKIETGLDKIISNNILLNNELGIETNSLDLELNEGDQVKISIYVQSDDANAIASVKEITLVRTGDIKNALELNLEEIEAKAEEPLDIYQVLFKLLKIEEVRNMFDISMMKETITISLDEKAKYEGNYGIKIGYEFKE